MMFRMVMVGFHCENLPLRLLLYIYFNKLLDADYIAMSKIFFQ